MAYIKNEWVNQNVERPRTYQLNENVDGSVTLIDDFGQVTELGTPVNADNMNHIEDGVAGVAIRLFNLTEIFALNEWVKDGEKLYKSLQNQNQGHAISEVDWWEEVSLGGGGQIIGQTIFSLDPLYEAGIHLFDGALIEKTGIYKDFYNTYLTKLKASHPERFITEEVWQESVSKYGVCGKYVDGVDTFRLPKVTGIVEGTLDVRALGDVIEAGLPNITGGIDSPSKWLKLSIPATKVTGAIKIENSGAGGAQTGNTNGYGKLTFNASDSNPIYGASDTVQPQTTKGYLYLVMANSTKTQIEVDIDNVVTDLNGKLNTDCSNATPNIDIVIDSKINSDGSWYRKYKSGWLVQGGNFKNTKFNNYITFNLLRPYKNIDYTISATTGGNPTNIYAVVVGGITTTSFNAKNGTNAGATDIYWRTEGQGA